MSGKPWLSAEDAKLRALYAEGTHTDIDLAKALGRTPRAVCNRRAALSLIDERYTTAPRELPDDWEQWAPIETDAALGVRYSAHNRTISRWRRQSGIVRLKPVRAQVQPQRKLQRVRRVAVRVANWGAPAQAPIAQRPTSLADDAAFELKKIGPVYRAKVSDPTAPDDQWMVWGRRMSEDEMLRKAASKGWKAAA